MKCKYSCGHATDLRDRLSDHENNCLLNPENKCCETCTHVVENHTGPKNVIQSNYHSCYGAVRWVKYRNTFPTSNCSAWEITEKPILRVMSYDDICG